MAPTLSTLAPMCLVALALAGCSVDAVTAAKAATAGQQAAATSQQAAATKADAAQAPAQASAQAQASGGQGTGSAPTAPKKPAPPAPPATDENADAAGAAGGTVLAGSDGASDFNDTPGTNQGIAVGEPAPGSSPSADRLVAPDQDPNACAKEFMTADANGDARLDLAEWQGVVVGGTAADFKALDANKDGAIDRPEYGCELR